MLITIEFLREDYRKSRLNIFKLIGGAFIFSNFWLVVLYRLANWLNRSRIPYIPALLMSIGKILYSAEIDPSSNIGPGFQIVHSVGLVVGPKVIAGRNFRIHQNVTIGMRERQDNGRVTPFIGDDVTVFAGAAILGPIKIGDNVKIGANAVVIDDMPSNVTVGGIPAKIIKKLPTIETT
jgi:serine O-acetyltransferase